MTINSKCCVTDCNEKAINYIWIYGESTIQKKKYKMLIGVCQEHYDVEKKANSILGKIDIHKIYRKLIQ